MGFARTLWCLLVSVGLVLSPLSTLHAHVTDHTHTHIHGGHAHDLTGDHDKLPTQVVDLKASPSDFAPAKVTWADWAPLFFVLALVCAWAPPLVTFLRHPRRDTEPILRLSFRVPPLRGPPLTSIHAR